MTILELIQSDGFFSKAVGSTGGGEFAGPCPWCGGDDRFRCWPNQGEAGKYWCRGCGRSGDALQYLRDFRHMTFPEACQFLGRELPPPSSLTGNGPGKASWEPRATCAPGDLWQIKARAMVADASYHLFQPLGTRMLGWLTEKRGLTVETVKAAGLGYLPTDRWDLAPAWGLVEVLKDDGKPKKLWFPRGLTIPLWQCSQILRLRIRRPKSDGDPRYYLVRGSDTRAMILGRDQPLSILVESELDALLLHQEAGDLVNVVSLGNAQTRPDHEAADLLQKSRLILVALDADQAGAKESWQWWREHYPQAHRWPPVAGKDPGDMLAAGVNLRSWIEAGLDEYAKSIVIQTEPEPEPPPITLPAGVCIFHECDRTSYQDGALFCGEAGKIVLDLAGCPFGLWTKTPDGWPVEEALSGFQEGTTS
jgi:DNA primase